MAKPSKLARTIYAQERNEAELLDRRGVLGVATGLRIRSGEITDQVCVQVFVERKLPADRLAARELVPAKLPGFEGEQVRTDVVEITPPVAQQDTTRYRPVPGGCSIGPESFSAGTLGGYAGDRTDNSIVLLSANHVISNLDTMPTARRIVQPSALDNGQIPSDVIGTLRRHAPVTTVANEPGAVPPLSPVDAAIGTIDVPHTHNVLEIGEAIYELQTPMPGQAVQKRGRTTGLTKNAKISAVNGIFDIIYRNGTRLGRVATTLVCRSTDRNPFASAGDSGSLIFNQQQAQLTGTFPALGLQYAGSREADGTPLALANDINAVFGELDLMTMCTYALRDLIGTSSSHDVGMRRDETRPIADKERQLRALREQVRGTPVGKGLDDVVSREVARLTDTVLSDPKVYGLAVRALEPLLRQRTVLDMLEMEIEPRTAETVTQLVQEVRKRTRDKELRAQLEAAGKMAGAAAGSSLEQLLSRL
ncbi:MAG: hypothetical protein ACRD07_20715 [Acidimicrobiales bacterium]